MSRTFCVYILASHARRLYVGVTSNLQRRLWEHRAHVDADSFTTRYHGTRLVHYECDGTAIGAIEREKQIKSWRREQKIRLIEETNPDWRDLGADLLPEDDEQIPRRRRCARLARDDDQGRE